MLRGRGDGRPGRLHAFEAGASAAGAAGQHIVRIFEAGDLLERSAEDAALWTSAWPSCPGIGFSRRSSTATSTQSPA